MSCHTLIFGLAVTFEEAIYDFFDQWLAFGALGIKILAQAVMSIELPTWRPGPPNLLLSCTGGDVEVA